MRDDDKGMRGTNSLAKSLFFMARPKEKTHLCYLLPMLSEEVIIGVMPERIERFADEFIALSPFDAEDFIADLPHRYWEEYVLHLAFAKRLGIEDDLTASPLVPEAIKEALLYYTLRKTGNVTIRPCTEKDVGRISELATASFYDAFIKQNDEEAMKAYLHTALSKAAIEKELQKPKSQMYFALCDGLQIGWMELNWLESQNEPMGEDALEVQRLYVHPWQRSQGVGEALLRFAEEVAKEKGCRRLWLGVWEENERGIAFYRRMGFSKVGSHPFVLGDEVQKDWLMEKSW